MMTDNLRELFPEELSDETAYHLSTFLYELALAFESIYLGQIMRYHKSRTDFRHEMVQQNKAQDINAEKDPGDPGLKLRKDKTQYHEKIAQN